MSLVKQGSLGRAKKRAEKLLKNNKLAEAKEAYAGICQLAPGDHEAWLNYGAIAARLGVLPEAEQALRRALELNANLPQAQFNLGKLLFMQGRLAEAEAPFQAYLRLQPRDLQGYPFLGQILEYSGRDEEAEALYRKGLEIAGRHAGMSLGLGRILHRRRDYDAARACCAAALEQEPADVAATLELGHIQREQGQFEEARRCYEAALKLDPRERTSVWLSLAALHNEQGEYQQALEAYDQALKLNPNSAGAHWSRSLILLLLGRYREGWDEYEWRLRYGDWLRQMGGGRFAGPPWDGSDPRGKTLLVYGEQGFGDTLQFIRYLPRLVELGAELIFYCQPELLPLVHNMPGLKGVDGVRLEPRDFARALEERCDYHLPLLSLPRLLGELEPVGLPAGQPYLEPSAEVVTAWRDRLQQGEFKVGLVWAGSGGHAADYRRSCQLELFAPLAELQGITLYSLQLGPASSQCDDFSHREALVDLAPHIEDFSHTAAAVANLDLVITVDTAVAHLAGAMGRPVWVLLYAAPDWRWGQEGEETPWYPSMRLFRQGYGEAWSVVVARVTAALRQQLAAGASSK